jgi:hypothetical protein
VTVSLEWRVVRPTETDENMFVHLLTADGTQWGQWDGPPLGGSYATSAMEPGERVLMEVTVPVSASAPPGELTAMVGWYDWRNMERLAVNHTADTMVEIGSTTVGPGN